MLPLRSESAVKKAASHREPPLIARYMYVTPSTVSDSSTGDTVSAHKNTAQDSPLRVWCFHCRQPNMPAAIPTTNDTPAMTNTQVDLSVDAIAAEMPTSHRMWPTTNPPIPATKMVLN